MLIALGIVAIVPTTEIDTPMADDESSDVAKDLGNNNTKRSNFQAGRSISMNASYTIIKLKNTK